MGPGFRLERTGLWHDLGFRLVLAIQKTADFCFERPEIILDAPSDFLTPGREFYTADQLGRDLEPDARFSSE